MTIPEKSEFTEEISMKLVRENPVQTVADVAGSAVGRIPLKLAKIFSNFLDDGNLKHLTAFYKVTISHGMSIDFGAGPKLNCLLFRI